MAALAEHVGPGARPGRDLPASREAQVGRNRPCPCGSGSKYKRCCLEQDQAHATIAVADPLLPGEGRLRQCIAYGRKVYDLRQGLEQLSDGRLDPDISTYVVAAAVFFSGLLRIRSFNALEPKLAEKTFITLVGQAVGRGRLCSADTLSRVLRTMGIDGLRRLSTHMLAQAERNKVFREGWVGALRYVAVDGWEPIRSYHRHCSECLIRHVKRKRQDGSEEIVEQYYHRYVVAMLIDERFDMALDFEPLLPEEMRPDADQNERDEGELTATKRLLRRVKKTYPWLDVALGDGLYANGPFLTLAKDLALGAIVVAKKGGDEPLREAHHLWDGQPPASIFVDEEKKEKVELWDCPELRTLSSYDGPIRVVRADITDLDRPAATRRTWCFLVTGVATKLSARQVLKAGRGRWHLENTGFNQWTQHWRFEHVFTHDAHAITALYWLFFIAYNLLTLFLYRQLRCYGRDRGRDVNRTILRLVDEMNDDLARLKESPWGA